jgi:hypothetical protein
LSIRHGAGQPIEGKSMRTLTSRAATVVAAAVIALTTMTIQPAAAGYRRSNDAAAFLAFAAVFGTVAAIIASQQHRDRHPYSYSHGPAYGGPAYGPPDHGYWQHNRQPHWGHR